MVSTFNTYCQKSRSVNILYIQCISSIQYIQYMVVGLVQYITNTANNQKYTGMLRRRVSRGSPLSTDPSPSPTHPPPQITKKFEEVAEGEEQVEKPL